MCLTGIYYLFPLNNSQFRGMGHSRLHQFNVTFRFRVAVTDVSDNGINRPSSYESSYIHMYMR